jgi:malic enzyme
MRDLRVGGYCEMLQHLNEGDIEPLIHDDAHGTVLIMAA